MLVLHRDPEESIRITIKAGTVIPPEGLTVDLKVLSVRGNHVRLGFEAPNVINIARSEVRNFTEKP